MGKYMKKSKVTAEVSLVEVAVSPHTTAALSGVLTRAKTLALRRLRSTTPHPNPSPSSSSFCYLELRSRRLRKPPIKPRNQLPRPRQVSRGSSGFHRPSPGDETDGSSLASSRPVIGSASDASVSMSCEEMQSSCEGHFGNKIEMGCSEDSDRGENNSESDEQSKRTRRLVQVDKVIPDIPTAHEMEEFFTFAEQEQRRLFIEKYNYDVFTDAPLPGRFEWVQVRP